VKSLQRLLDIKKIVEIQAKHASERKMYFTPLVTFRASCSIHLSPWICRRTIPSAGATYRVQMGTIRVKTVYIWLNKNLNSFIRQRIIKKIVEETQMKGTRGEKQIYKDKMKGIYISQNTIPWAIEDSLSSN
jgi:hypothetical protein